jgi:hypothetical protein
MLFNQSGTLIDEYMEVHHSPMQHIINKNALHDVEGVSSSRINFSAAPA